MIKILHITESLRGGGKERQIVELLKANQKSQEYLHELVIIKDINEYPETKTLNTRIHVLHYKYRKDLSIFSKFKKIVKEFNPDIIQSWGSMASIYSFMTARSLNIKFLNYSIQNGICRKYGSEWIRGKIVYPRSDIVAANSYAGIEAYPAPQEKAHVIYNGVHLERFENLQDKSIIRKKFKIETPYVIGMVGALHPRKDFYTFIKAANILCQSRNDITFVIIGNGTMQEELEKTVIPDVRNKILFLGRQSDVESIVNVFDVAVLTTNNDVHREGIANVIIEYMALGKPVIATLGGGTPEIVDNHITGKIIRQHSVGELVNGITYFLDNERDRQEFGRRGKEKIEKGFTIDLMNRAFCELYKEMMN